MSSKKGFGFLFLILTLSLMLPASSLRSQAACSGTACNLLNFSNDQFNNVFTSFKYQYADPMLKEMASAALLATSAGVPVGTVNLYTYTLGAQVGVGGVKPHDVNVYVPEVGRFEKVQSAGAGVSPRIFVGANLGKLLEFDTDNPSADPPALLSPYKFDVYLSALSASYRKNKIEKGNKPTSYFANNSTLGIEVRYHLLEQMNITDNALLKFLGVSLGAGYSRTSTDIQASQMNSQLKMKLNQYAGRVIWSGFNRVTYKGKSESYPIDIKTGIQALHFLNLTVGAGVIFNRSSANLALMRGGPAFLETNLPALLGASIPDANLMLHIPSDGKARHRVTYLKGGVEFNIFNLKIGVEAIKSNDVKNLAGLNTGVRWEF